MTTFRKRADEAAIAWKETTSTLPDEARAPGCYRGRGSPYEFCLPIDSAALNLLPDARAAALDRFERFGIPWHHGSRSLPSNHLMSSQVACANALAPLLHRPDAIGWLFADVLDIVEVLPFSDPASPEDHLVFEWVGLIDHLGERPGKPLSRGAHMTSADAAIRYRTSSGAIEIALIEWRFTERYGCAPVDLQSASNVRRMKTYSALLADPDSPMREIAPEHFLVEPIYQLVRQQLLAWRMELASELGASRVVVVEAAPTANAELWASVPASLGSDLREVFPAMLRRPDRWVHLDTARLLAVGSPASSEFKARYAALSSAVNRPGIPGGSIPWK